MQSIQSSCRNVRRTFYQMQVMPLKKEDWKMPRTSENSLKLLTDVVWQADGNDGDCPPEKQPQFSPAR